MIGPTNRLAGERQVAGNRLLQDNWLAFINHSVLQFS
jgi:hypothetical protein